jgi:hypothetical protein
MMTLPLKTNKQKVSIYYHELKNMAIKLTVEKYSTPSRVNFVSYKNLDQLK